MDSNFKDLVRQVEYLEDYEQAAQALMKIVHRDPATGGSLALNLLRSKSGDTHLRAFAFSMLYRANRSLACEFVRENSSVCESAVFLAMLGEVVEDVGLLDDSKELQQMVDHLRSAILHRSDVDNEATKQEVHEFLKIYGTRDI